MKKLIIFLFTGILFTSCSILYSIDVLVDKIEYENEIMYNTDYVIVDSVQQRKYENLIFVHGSSNKYYYRFVDNLIYYISDTIEFTDEIYSKSIMKRIKIISE